MPPLTVAEPTWAAPSKIATVSPFTPVPVNVGVVTLVMLSVLDVPESEAAVKSGVPGAADAVVSMVTDRALEVPTFPAASVVVAVMLCTPLPNVEVVIV